MHQSLSQHVDAILTARHPNPFAFLGLHKEHKADKLCVRTFQPSAKSVAIVSKKNRKTINKLVQIGNTGLFTITTRRRKHFDYWLKINDGYQEKLIEDPFSMPLVLGDHDIDLLRRGVHPRPYQVLGSHSVQLAGLSGISFTVWAPNASHVAVVGDFNQWDGRIHPMRLRHDCGIWEIFIPELTDGSRYKFEIKNSHGKLLPLKADPYATESEYRPATASIISKPIDYPWSDHHWMTSRQRRNEKDQPISIYEVHLGSWKRNNGDYLNYRELAASLIPYATMMNFTHLQLMPVSEYPYDGSWGYQPVGLFSPTSRYKSQTNSPAEDFCYFIEQCHLAELGVLIDWVPAHFPQDEHGLAQFDGSFLFEHADPEKGFHPDWKTLIYNYGRAEVINFLVASALHWIERFHVDGIRVDAVASMLYLDYSRKPGEWQPNIHGGNENLEAIEFIRQFNQQLSLNYPSAFSVAEESTSWPGVTAPVESDGLGFGYKWNMGWMNDSIEYFKRDPIYRRHHHNELCFSLEYAFSENFILPISHDEVVHGKGTMLNKMPGDSWQKYANLRAFYGFMWTHPGKKLLFMGCEFAQQKEWNFDQQLDWEILNIPTHKGIQNLVKDLNQLYRSLPALHQLDCHQDGFEWLIKSDSENSVYAFIRKARLEEPNNTPDLVLVVINLTPQTHHDFILGVPHEGFYCERLNSDSSLYGGSNQGNLGGIYSRPEAVNKYDHSICITLPPLSTVIFERQ